MAKDAFKTKLSELKSDLLNTPVAMPLQKVIPVKELAEPKRSYTQISAYIEDATLEAVKMKCLKEKKKLSPLIEELLQAWLGSTIS